MFSVISIGGVYNQYQIYGEFEDFTFLGLSFPLLNIGLFVWTIGAHFMHVVSGYWIAKGLKKGIVFGFIVSGWETVGFLILFQDVLFLPHGLAIRILFAAVMFFMIYGIKDLTKLKSANWKPWMNPLAAKTIDNPV